MRAFLKMAGMATVLALTLTLAVGTTQADGAKAPSTPEELLKALAEAGKPGPEHKKLEPFVGNWNFTMKVWTDPSQPPAELKGTVERKWIMDGRFVQESVRGACAKSGKTFEGMGLVGYDAAQKKFSCVKACGLCGTVSSSLVTADPTGTRFECTKEECCPLSGQKIKGRDEVILEGKDKIVTNIYKTINDKEVKVIEIISIRQK
ncbi:hypothetical protein AYO44_16815 [Planctomycetaceae bacterium SCGC AG-212-F19]|nr:hypothetical protein AYO44_16815 [Planctomycetaceae bacterium SCGC AG-212-F19]